MKKLLSILMLLVAIVTGAWADQTYHTVTPNVENTQYEMYALYSMYSSKAVKSDYSAWVSGDVDSQNSSSYEEPAGWLDGASGKPGVGFLQVKNTKTITFYVTNCVSVAMVSKSGGNGERYCQLSVKDAATNTEVSSIKQNGNTLQATDYETPLNPTKNYIVTLSGTVNQNQNFYQIRFEAPSAPSGKTATTTTITSDSKSALKLDLKDGTSAGTLAATVVDAESKAVEGATVSWESSNTGVAEINASTGVVTLKATGTTTLKATYAGNDNYAESEDSYEITVTDTRTASDLSVASEASVKIGKTETVAYTTSSTGAVSVESSNNSVATAVVDQVNKNITISGVAAGVATITVSQLADDDYAAGSKEISVTVIDPIAGTVIYNWNTVGTTTIAGAATTANVSIKGTSTSAISFPNGLTKPAYAKIEVEGGFKKGDIITWTGCVSNSNSSKVGAIMIANGYDDQAEGFKAYLDCSEMFNNVNDGQTAASSDSFVLNEDATELYIGRTIGLDNATNTYVTQLTVTRPSTETVTIGKGGFSTFAGEYNYTVSGAKALAAQNKSTSVGFTEIPSETVIPANTGVVLQGAEGDKVTITYTTEDASTVTTDMVGVTEANPFSASDNVYVIATKTAGTKFYKYTGSTFPVGKAYLNAPANAPGSLDIDFGGETAINGIDANENANSVAPVKVIKNGKLYIGNYNVAGQQVK